jgi:hypothetical protein
MIVTCDVEAPYLPFHRARPLCQALTFVETEMADYFTHFSCVLDVGTPDNTARALDLYPGWHSHRSIQRMSIIIWRPLTTTPPRIIIIRPSITTRSASTKMPSSTQLRLTSIAGSLINMPRQPTLNLINDDVSCAVAC